MSYIDERTKQLREIHSVYSHDISDSVCELVNLPDFKRIGMIDKNGGVLFSSFNTFNYRYSRLDHSFGVAIILENFKQDKCHILEAISHELQEACFAWSIDYLLKYFKIKSFELPKAFDKIISLEDSFKDYISQSFSLMDVSNYKDYALGFADYPKLSAENLEFILSNSYLSGLYDLNEIEEFYNNISICKNEDNKDEFCFSDLSLAYKFFKLSIEIGKRNRSYEAKITRQLISDVIMLMIRREEIKLEDLFDSTDKGIMEIGKACSDKRIKEGWQAIENLDRVDLKFNESFDKTKYCVKTNEKSIYVDPLVKTKAGIYRLSSLDERVDRDIDAYLSTDTDMFMCINYEL